MTDWKITPTRTRSMFPKVLTQDDKIDIFHERVIGWQIDIADAVANGIRDKEGKIEKGAIEDSGFAVLDILLSYFEMIAKYKDGYCDVGDSGKYFEKGFNMVFPQFEKECPWLARKMYTNARCGLYHHGMTEEDIILTGSISSPIKPLADKKIVINPHILVLALREHFGTYIEELRNDKDFRRNFEKRFDYDNS
jgi:hypothetical protein